MYRKFREDPSSVDPSWHEFLVDYNPEPTTDSSASENGRQTRSTATAAPKARPEPAPAPAPKAQDSKSQDTKSPAAKQNSKPQDSKPQPKAKPVESKSSTKPADTKSERSRESGTSSSNGAAKPAAQPADDSDQIMLVTDRGQLIRIPVEGISIMGRSTQGVIVLDTAEDERVVSVEHIPDENGNGG